MQRCIMSSPWLLTIYGGQVCPLIDTLTLAHWGTIVSGAFILLVMSRAVLVPRLVECAPLLEQSVRTFYLELGLFTAFGVGLSVFDHAILGFPRWKAGSRSSSAS